MHITSISLISSTTCNLDCSFCYLTKNQSYKEFDKKVRAAWHDGSYIDNVVKTVSAFCSPEEVTICQLWGGETLLHIEDIIPNIEKLYKNFPNIESWKFSTNWMINVEKFFQFILEIEKFANKETDIEMQLSIDGPAGPFTETGHNGNWDIYYANLKKFTDLMNNTKLRKIKLGFSIKSTVNKDLFFETFSTKEGMKEWYATMSKLSKDIDEMCVSSALCLRQYVVFPCYALPCQDSSEDGKRYVEIVKMWEEVRRESFPDHDPHYHFYIGVGNLGNIHNMLVKNLECSELTGALTINYDGSICECNGSFIDSFEPYQQELLATNKINEYQIAKLRSKVMYNPALVNDKELEKKDWYIHNGYKNTQQTYIHFMLALADELAASGQIDEKYIKDRELLLKHLIAIAGTNSCTRENIANTKTPYMCSIGTIRRYLNGVVDFAYEQTKADLIEQREKYIYNHMGECNYGCSN